MKIPNLPLANITLSGSVSAPVAEKFNKAIDEFKENINPDLEKYKGMENAPIIPYEDPFKGRHTSNLELPSYFGMRHYKITSSAIDMRDPHKERTYQYGELTDVEDINAYLDQLERLEGEHKIMFEHLKPTKELLSLAEKMSDEELAQFAEFMVEISGVEFFQTQKSTVPDELITALNAMSEDELSSSIEAMSSILSQGEGYQKTASPVGADKYGRENAVLFSYQDGMELKAGYYGNNAGNKLAKNFAKLLTDNKLNSEQLIEMNHHISQSSFEQSRGIVDMAGLVSKHMLDDMLSMLDEADKDNAQNIFSYLGQQVNYQAHRQYYQTDKGDYVVQQDDIASESDRRNLYENILTAHNEFGLGWISDALDEVQDTPAQIQKEIWQQLLDDKEATPDNFIKSDSLETWADNNLASIELQFHAKQTMKIHEFNSELFLPEILSNLTFYASGNHKLANEADVKEGSPQS